VAVNLQERPFVVNRGQRSWFEQTRERGYILIEAALSRKEPVRPGRREGIMTGEKGYEAEQKLCHIENIGKDHSTFETYKRLVEDPKYICTGCGRWAKDGNNLCSPHKM
jgi:hypothetical protein